LEFLFRLKLRIAGHLVQNRDQFLAKMLSGAPKVRAFGRAAALDETLLKSFDGSAMLWSTGRRKSTRARQPCKCSSMPLALAGEGNAGRICGICRVSL
jgi:hypothetical protein